MGLRTRIQNGLAHEDSEWAWVDFSLQSIFGLLCVAAALFVICIYAFETGARLILE